MSAYTHIDELTGMAWARLHARPLIPVPLLIHLAVNGQRREALLESGASLLDALRDHLQLTGTQRGCDHGACGACAVQIDGQRILACRTLAVDVQGLRIDTVEGLTYASGSGCTAALPRSMRSMRVFSHSI